jgi:hypothetical protein
MAWTPEQAALKKEIERLILRPVELDDQSGPLYHYTDGIGFKGIIETGKIWATHFDYLNDRRELRHGEDSVLEEVKAFEAALPRGTAGQYLMEHFIRLDPDVRLSTLWDTYLASFSEFGDQLSQWRAYGCDGVGFAIGFGALPRPRGDDPDAALPLDLIKCEYDPGIFKKKIREILVEVTRHYEEFVQSKAGTDEALRAIYDSAWKALFMRISTEVPRLKHASFSEEREWRLAVLPMPDQANSITRFRTRRAGLCPYVEVDLRGPDGKIDLAEVIIGPGQDQQRSLKSARMFLRQHGYDRKDLVRVSATPYRGGAA